MWPNRQKHDGLIGAPFTETILTFRHTTTFFTDDENDTKVTVNAGAPHTTQIEFVCRIREQLCVGIRRSQNTFDTLLMRSRKDA
jgi:hypothetical protein